VEAGTCGKIGKRSALGFGSQESEREAREERSAAIAAANAGGRTSGHCVALSLSGRGSVAGERGRRGWRWKGKLTGGVHPSVPRVREEGVALGWAASTGPVACWAVQVRQRAVRLGQQAGPVSS
jgi:hypothetical protein